MADSWDSSLLRKNESELVKQKFVYPKLLASKTLNKSFSIGKLKRNFDAANGCSNKMENDDDALQVQNPLLKRTKIGDNFSSLISTTLLPEISGVPKFEHLNCAKIGEDNFKVANSRGLEKDVNFPEKVCDTLEPIENNNFSPTRKHTKVAPRFGSSTLLKRNLSSIINSIELEYGAPRTKSGVQDSSYLEMSKAHVNQSENNGNESLQIPSCVNKAGLNTVELDANENLRSVLSSSSGNTENCRRSFVGSDNQLLAMQVPDLKSKSGSEGSKSINSGSSKLHESERGATSDSSKRESNIKCDNFIKLNMKQKTFVKGNSRFALNRKRFKHKQFQRATSRRENNYAANSSKNGYRSSWNISNTTTSAPKTFEAAVIPDALAFVKETALSLIPKFPNINLQAVGAENFVLSEDDFLGMMPSALKTFKIQSLLSWQMACVSQIVQGKSSLVIKPTGSGKSLCYQLPALMLYKKFKTVTIVVSPLISLMDDQVKNCPRGLKAACYHSALTESKRNNVLKDLADQKLAVLFVSPEMVVEGFKLRQLENFPPIGFACIDEVHCISQWSHNFRPSYFRLFSSLKSWGISCFLGITATASKQTEIDMGNLLAIEENQMYYDVRIPTNLRISASSDSHRLQSLTDLLEKEPFKSFKSVLIYCTKRNDCDVVASHIRTVFGEQDMAESYHAGKTSSERAQIQKRFMNENLKIVAATVAFGMGLNKSNIRAVIHYNISGSVENFIQEIGRAGRNSTQVAYCHTFLNKDSMVDLYEQERHVYSSYVEPSTIRKVGNEVFSDLKNVSCEFEFSQSTEDHYHYAAVDLSLANSLDVKEETLLTLISYLETHPLKPVVIEKIGNDFCSAHFYNGFNLPRTFFDEFPVYKTALKLSESGQGATRDGNKLSFKISTIANYINKPYENITRSLFASQTKNMGIKISVTAKSAVFKLKCCKDDLIEMLTEFLLDQTKNHERSKIRSLHFLFSDILMPVAEKSVFSCFPDEEEKLSNADGNSEIAGKVMNYFENTDGETKTELSGKFRLNEKEEYLARQKVRTFVSLYHDMDLTGLVVCRILQGMDSPSFPASTWCTVGKFWKSFVNCDFKSLLKICNEEVMKRC